MLLHSSTTITNSCCFFHSNPNSKDSNPKAAHFLLPKSFFPASRTSSRSRYGTNSRGGVRVTCLLETPVVWAGRLCVFYALLKAGIAGSPSNPIVADLQTGGDGFGFSRWFEELRGKSGEEKEAAARRKLVSKWHPTTKGTLKRNYRVPSKTEGRRVLKAIASLLSDDDHFRDATSHKGCQIRRESAHGESVCCNNVRALFDELPTPHLLVEITPFPAGPLSHTDYSKAEKLERGIKWRGWNEGARICMDQSIMPNPCVASVRDQRCKAKHSKPGYNIPASRYCTSQCVSAFTIAERIIAINSISFNLSVTLIVIFYFTLLGKR